MARTVEQVLKDILGAQAFQIAVLTAQLEKARELAAPATAQKASDPPRLSLVEEQSG
jgi:hypothetical protein